MGVMLFSDNVTPCSGRDETYNSGFNGPYCNIGETESKSNGILFPNNSKYYDLYTYGNDDEHYNRRILGDAELMQL